MPGVGVVTDSAASIPEHLMTTLGIRWVPCYIYRGQEVLRDLVNIQRDEFYRWMLTATEMPKSASPGPGDYVSAYQQLASEGVTDIISIHVTSRGSGAYQAAIAAQNMLQETHPGVRIEVVDSLNVAMCQGWMTIEAARSALAGKSLDEILAQVRAMIPVTRMIQTADTLKYLFMGGRIGKAKHLIGSLLNIKPLISLEDGVIVSLGTVRSRGKAYESIANLVEQFACGSKIKIAYMHAAARDEVDRIRALVEARVECVETLFAELSPVLGVHSGPGTVGVCFFPVQSA